MRETKDKYNYIVLYVKLTENSMTSKESNIHMNKLLFITGKVLYIP